MKIKGTFFTLLVSNAIYSDLIFVLVQVGHQVKIAAFQIVSQCKARLGALHCNAKQSVMVGGGCTARRHQWGILLGQLCTVRDRSHPCNCPLKMHFAFHHISTSHHHHPHHQKSVIWKSVVAPSLALYTPIDLCKIGNALR